MTITWVFLSCLLFVAANGELYDSLHEMLMASRPQPIIPMVSKDTPVTVKLGLSLISLLELNTENMYARTLNWVSLYWRDARLAWNPIIYGVKDIRLPQDFLWIPDISLPYGTITKTSVDYKAIVTSDGEVMVFNQVELSSPCSLLGNANDDTVVECKTMMGSWTYTGEQLDLQTQSQNASIDVLNYHENPGWSVISTTAQRVEHKYPCCTETYPDITYTVTYEKKVQH